MKILYDNIIFNLQRSGGISLYWSELIKRHISHNSSISFIEEGESNNYFRETLNISNSAIIKPSRLFPPSIARYRDVRNKSEYNIFHSSYYRSANKLSKSNVNAVTVHDFIYEQYAKGIRKSLHCWQKGRALLNADGIICVSESTKRDLLRFYPECAEKPIEVIYNGVSDVYRPVDPEEAGEFVKRYYGIKRTFILYVGARTAAYKNFHLVVESLKKNSVYDLVIVGGGSLLPVEKILLNSNLPNRYLHLEYIPSEDLNRLYNAAYCLLYLSLYEGFGLPLVEAQRAGCPIIAYHSSSIPEIVATKDVLLNKLTENLIEQKFEEFQNSRYRELIIREGLQKSLNFSWDSCYKKSINFYNTVLKHSNG